MKNTVWEYCAGCDYRGGGAGDAMRRHRTDMVALLPADMLTVDMVPGDPATWLFHCHVSDQMDAGMVSKYEVRP